MGGIATTLVGIAFWRDAAEEFYQLLGLVLIVAGVIMAICHV